jgi:hypothetical protein
MKAGCKLALVWMSAVLLPWPAHAARPFVTDDARIVDRGGCQIETYYKEQRTYQGSEFWFLPACNPFGVELTFGGNRIEGDDNAILQAKFLLRPLETNGWGSALSVGAFGGDPYANAIASFSFADDRAVIHANAGAIRDGKTDLTRWTWGLGLEALLHAPRFYGILETYGQRDDKPVLHGGLRFWILPQRVQLDTTVGAQSGQSGQPDRRFYTVGLRILF